MKFKKIIILSMLIFTLLMKVNIVKAYSLVGVPTDYKFTRYDIRDDSWFTGDFKYYSIDGVDSYCLDAGMHEGHDEYELSTFEALGLTEAEKERIALIGYYGYSYPGHQTDRMRMATQALIWITVMGEESWVTFTSDYWNGGTFYDTTKEREKIEALILKHKTTPSFSGSTYDAKIGEKITLRDTNEVLTNYNVFVTGADYELSGYNLIITPKETGTISINMKRKIEDGPDFKIFAAENVQRIFSVGKPPTTKAKFDLNVTSKSRIKIRKVDTENLNTLGTITLENATYGVFDTNDNQLATLTTDANGQVISTDMFDSGTYYLKELSPSYGYELDTTRYEFTINQGEEIVEIEVNEQAIKKGVTIIKKYDSNTDYSSFPQKETKSYYEIKTLDGTLYKTIPISDQGVAEVYLPFGTWIINQINKDNSNSSTDEFRITIDENSPNNLTYEVQDTRFSSYVKITNVDKDINRPILNSDAKLKILNVDTNIFIKQQVNGILSEEFTLESNGSIKLPLKLPEGHYQLIQTKEPAGYVSNSETLFFDILESDDTIKDFTFSNKAIKGKIQINHLGEVFLKQNNQLVYTNMPFANTEFAIYCDNDIILGTGETYCQKNDKLETLTTDKNGYVESSILPLGTYYIKELTASDNYVKNDNSYVIELKPVDNKTEVISASLEILDELEKKAIKIIKSGEAATIDKDFKYEKIPLGNINFDIYLKNEIIYPNGKKLAKNTKVDSITTTETGEALSILLPTSEYYIKEITTLKNFEENKEEYQVKLTNTNSSNYQTIEVNNYLKKGQIEIQVNGEVVDYTSEYIDYIMMPLSNINLDIYTASDITNHDGTIIKKDTKVATVTTLSNGSILSPELPLGKYYIRENWSMENYVLNSKKYNVTIKELKDEENIVHIDIDNQLKKGQIEITKTGEELVIENGKLTYKEIPLNNISFDIYTKNDIFIADTYIAKDTKLQTIQTNEDGIALSSLLPLGEYYIKEREALPNYIKNENIYNVTLKGSNKTSTIINGKVKIKNDLSKGQIKIDAKQETFVLGNDTFKYDTLPLPNTTFSIYAKEDMTFANGRKILKDTLMEQVKTTNQGTALSSSLPLGKYYLIQDTIWESDIVKDNDYSIELKSNDTVENIEVINNVKKGNLLLTKIDKDDGAPIPNVVFNLYDEDDNFILSFKTDELGQATIQDLPLGKYYLIESEAPDGYMLNNEKYYFNINDNEPNKIILENDKIFPLQVEVPQTFLSNFLSLKKLGLSFITLGVIPLFHGKKKKKN